MTTKEEQDLIEYLRKCCTHFNHNGKSDNFLCYSIADVNNAIAMFKSEHTEEKICDCKPDYETINEELRKELDHWKAEAEYNSMVKGKYEAIIRTVEQFTNTNLLNK